MPISLLLALRFLSGAHKEKNISVMIKVCFLSILISTFALTLIVSVMKGFEKATHDKLQGIHSDLIMRAHGQPIDFDKLKNVIDKEFNNSIIAIAPSSIAQVIIQPGDKKSDNNKKESNSETNLVMLQAIDPELEPKVSALKDMLVEKYENTNNWSILLKNNNIFVGYSLAQNLFLKINDNIDLLFPDDEIYNNKVTLNNKQAKIAAIFKTGINEFDEHVIFCSLSFFNQIFDSGITQISLKLKDISKEKEIIKILKARFSMEVYSWKDLYPAIVSALMLEKYAMFFILALVTLVASMNIISLLFMYVTQKRGEIAILKSMGVSDNSIISIFILLALSISLLACLSGIILAAIVSVILNKYPFIKLPDVYYVTHLPAHMDWQLVFIILIVVLLLSFFSTIIPAFKVKQINIAQVLKDELI